MRELTMSLLRKWRWSYMGARIQLAALGLAGAGRSSHLAAKGKIGGSFCDNACKAVRGYMRLITHM